jgi:phosphoglycolate phosphatase
MRNPAPPEELKQEDGIGARKCDAVVFDLDGTLLDTLRDIADSVNRALESMGFAPHPVDRYRTMVGDGVEILARRALPEIHHDAKTVAALAKAYREDYGRNWAVHSAAYPGIVELLTGLKQRGIRTAVLSNKPHAFTVQCVEQFLPGGEFEVVQGSGGQFPNKPDPAGALHIAGLMQLPPERFLYLGDTNTDMRTAVAAGMLPVGATWGFRDRKELIDSGAKAIADHPTDVLGLLG